MSRKSGRADTPRYKSQRDNVWEQQIKSEQLYNAVRKDQQTGISLEKHNSTQSDRLNGDFSNKQCQTSYANDIQSQGVQYQNSMIQRVTVKDQKQNPGLATQNSMSANFDPQYKEMMINFQNPETMSISSMSSFEDPYSKAESQMDEALQSYGQKTRQLEKQQDQTGHHRQSRRKMQDEIHKLRTELLAAQEKLDDATAKQNQLEKIVIKPSSASINSQINNSSQIAEKSEKAESLNNIQEVQISIQESQISSPAVLKKQPSQQVLYQQPSKEVRNDPEYQKNIDRLFGNSSQKTKSLVQRYYGEEQSKPSDDIVNDTDATN